MFPNLQAEQARKKMTNHKWQIIYESVADLTNKRNNLERFIARNVIVYAHFFNVSLIIYLLFLPQKRKRYNYTALNDWR